jgi:hypothetical protein
MSLRHFLRWVPETASAAPTPLEDDEEKENAAMIESAAV